MLIAFDRLWARQLSLSAKIFTFHSSQTMKLLFDAFEWLSLSFNPISLRWQGWKLKREREMALGKCFKRKKLVTSVTSTLELPLGERVENNCHYEQLSTELEVQSFPSSRRENFFFTSNIHFYLLLLFYYRYVFKSWGVAFF